MKKYILTIEYDGNSDEVESIKEEMIEPEEVANITREDIEKLTTQDMLKIMFFKEYGKAWLLTLPWRELCLYESIQSK